ncbi:MAG: hypothetical protein JWM74_1549 [Myxococcaceae bacterium]|nr:hypothetical protein [Myxococcaceae bacterium]
MSSVSGAVLAITFFLPAVRDCGAPLVPAEQLARHPPSSAGDVLGWFAVYVAAYLVGLLLSAAAVGRVMGADWGRKLLAGVVLLVSVTLGCLALFNLVELSRGFGMEHAAVALGALVVALYLASSQRLGAWGMLRGTMTIGFGMCVWFGFFALTDGALYGVRISFAAALGLLVATIVEGVSLLGRRLFW